MHEYVNNTISNILRNKYTTNVFTHHKFAINLNLCERRYTPYIWIWMHWSHENLQEWFLDERLLKTY